jgi:hypothetical protein
VFRPQLELWNPADQISFFRFVKHPAQRSKGTVGVRCRAAETESFHIILGYVIQAHADDFRRRFDFPARVADSTQLRNRIENPCRLGAFRSNGPIPPMAWESLKAAIFPALFLLVSLVELRYRLPRHLKSYQ